jgi:Rad3-related DNA helicase
MITGDHLHHFGSLDEGDVPEELGQLVTVVGLPIQQPQQSGCSER